MKELAGMSFTKKHRKNKKGRKLLKLNDDVEVNWTLNEAFSLCV